MPNPPTADDRSTDTRTETDTDVESIIEEIRAGEPGEHLAVEVGLTGYTVERIDVEREHGEGIQDWIRHAIDDYLADKGVDVATANAFEGPRVDVEHTDDTPVEEIFRRLDDVGRREHAPVGIELPGAVVEAIHDLEERTEPSVAMWIRTAIWRRFNNIDHDLKLKPTLEVEVPPQVAVRARLRAEHRAHRRGADYDDALLDSLNELVQPQPEFVLGGGDGDVLATFADSGGEGGLRTAATSRPGSRLPSLSPSRTCRRSSSRPTPSATPRAVGTARRPSPRTGRSPIRTTSTARRSP